MKSTGKKYLLFAVLIFVALAASLTFTADFSAGNTHDITIEVKDEAGNPVYDYVELWSIGEQDNPNPILENYGYISSLDGKITFENVSTDNYRYRVSYGTPGYAVNSGILEVESNVTESVTLTGGPSVTFNVKDKDNNSIENLEVSLNNQSDNYENVYYHYDFRQTDQNGIADFENVLPDNYQYSITSGSISENYTNDFGYIEVVEGENFEENITLENAPYTITFNVEDENSNLVENAEVYLGRENNTGGYDYYSWGETDENGMVKFSVPSDNYWYEVSKDNYLEDGYIEGLGSDITKNITLTKSTTYGSPYIKLNVQDLANGENVENATAGLWRLEGQNEPPVFVREKETDQEGEVVFENLTGENYVYNVGKGGYADNSDFVSVVDGNVTRGVTLSNADYEVIFNVLDNETGENIENAMVALFEENSDGENLVALKETDENGEAVFGFIADNYDYMVLRDGYEGFQGGINVNGNLTENVMLAELPSLTIKAKDDANGENVENATVSLWSMSGALPAFLGEKETNVDGEVVFNGLKSENYLFNVGKKGYADNGGYVFEVENDVTKLVSLSSSDYEVTFNVSDNETGENVENALVALFEENCGGNLDNLVALKETDENGKAIFEFVADNYDYGVIKEGYEDNQGRINVSGNLTENVPLTKPPNVTFKVQDNTGENISGAEVDLRGVGYGETDENGVIVFNNVQSGDYEYRVENDGFVTVENLVTVGSEDVTVYVTLEEAPYTITFNVEDENGEPIEQAMVHLEREVGNDEYDYYDGGETGSSGEVVFSVVDDNYRFNVDKDGFADNYGEIEVVNENIVENVMLEAAPYTITFSVEDENSDPVEGADVNVEREENGNYYGYDWGQTDSNGIFKVLIPADNYRYNIHRDGFADNYGEIEVVSENVVENVTLVKLETYDVKFKVRDEFGENVSGASVDLYGVDEKLTDENGWALFTNVVEGEYGYRVEKDGFAPVENHNWLVDNDVVKIVELENAPYTITFNVEDEENNSIPNADVNLDRQVNNSEDYDHYDWSQTDENGEVEFWVPSDNYHYNVDKSGYAGEGKHIEVLNENVVENVTLEAAPYKITFDVEDENSDPVGGADIRVEREENGSYYDYDWGQTDSNGVVEFWTPSDNYRYTVYSNAFAENHGVVEVVNENVFETVTLRTGVTLTIWGITGQGTVSVDGVTVDETALPFEKVYSGGASADLLAEADSGWNFAYWNGVDPDENDLTLTMDGNKTIEEAVFEEGTTEYVTLTIDNILGMGSVFVGNSEVFEGYSENFERGVEISLSAVPDNGYYFDNWFGDYVSVENEIVLSMDENLILSARFSQIKDYVLSIDVEGMGSTSPREGRHTYDNGTNVIVDAFPEEGWGLENWVGDVPENYSGENTVEVVMDDNKSLTAVFTEEVVVENVELSAGWNLFSLPVVPENVEVRAVFDNLGYKPDVVGWTDSYDIVEGHENLDVGDGYWVYLRDAENISVRGAPLDNFRLELNGGWNIAGLPSDFCPIRTDNVFDNLGYKPDVVGWTDSYDIVEEHENLKGGEGYWMYLRDAENIDVSV